MCLNAHVECFTVAPLNSVQSTIHHWYSPYECARLPQEPCSQPADRHSAHGACGSHQPSTSVCRGTEGKASQLPSHMPRHEACLSMVMHNILRHTNCMSEQCWKSCLESFHDVMQNLEEYNNFTTSRTGTICHDCRTWSEVLKIMRWTLQDHWMH